MPDEVEATAAAARHRFAVAVLVQNIVIVGELWRERGQRRVERGNGHDALL
jgi:hypothetical protein